MQFDRGHVAFYFTVSITRIEVSFIKIIIDKLTCYTQI